MRLGFSPLPAAFAVLMLVASTLATGPDDAPLASQLYMKAPDSPTENTGEGTGFTVATSAEGYGVSMWVRVRHMFTPTPPGNAGTLVEMFDTGTVSRTVNIGHEYFPGDLKHFMVFRDNAVTLKLMELPVPAPVNGNITNGDWHFVKFVVRDFGASTWYVRAFRNNVRDTTFDTHTNGQLVPGGATFAPAINTIRYNFSPGATNFGFDTDDMALVRFGGLSTHTLFETYNPVGHDNWLGDYMEQQG